MGHKPRSLAATSGYSRALSADGQQERCSWWAGFRTTDLPSWGSSSSLHDDLGRVHRVKARPLRGRFASGDTAATAKEDGGRDKDGVDQDAAEKHAPSSNSSSNAASHADLRLAEYLRDDAS